MTNVLKASLLVACCHGCHRLQPRTRCRENHADRFRRRLVLYREKAPFKTRFGTCYRAGQRMVTAPTSSRSTSMASTSRTRRGAASRVKMRLEMSTAPSVTGYKATETARCRPDGPPTAGELGRVLSLQGQFERYHTNHQGLRPRPSGARRGRKGYSKWYRQSATD